MKINGEFILRQVAGESILVPVGSTALKLNGIITLDPVGAVIWQALETGKEKPAILEEILEKFEVSADVASADLDEFLQMLKANKLLTE